MLTAESLVGKLVTFIVGKTVGKLAALSFDKKKKAARALTKLYFCLQGLDDVTTRIIQSLDDFKSSGNASAMMNSLNNHMHEIELATNMFIDLGYELQPGLEIIDPPLAACCYTLYNGKMDFLSFMSQSVTWDRTTSPGKIVIKVPQGRLESVDLESMYQESTQAFRSETKHYWPSGLFEFEGDFQDLTLTWESDEAALRLRHMIVQQNLALKDAKERLRSLIKENFSLEEVLFQTDSRPYF